MIKFKNFILQFSYQLWKLLKQKRQIESLVKYLENHTEAI